jgi:hypothetical protein
MAGLIKVKAQRMQLYHHENSDLEFIKRPVVGESVTEFDDTGDPKRSWIDYYETLYPFNGYEGVPADAVQLAYGRHFHLEIHDILKDDKRPPDTDSMINNVFITAVAESRAMELAKTAKPKTVYEKLTLLLGSGFIIELIIWGVALALKITQK